MPEITAFCGIRYNPALFGADLSKLVAPPYDVLSGEDKDALLAGHDRNIVAIDLPHVPPKTAGPDEVYQKAAVTLNQWLADGTLAADHKPALYVYHQEYSHAGQQFTRKKLFARMRLEPFGTGTVFPHEHTFGGPKADRLKLMTATRCQLSAVFGLYSDPSNTVSELLNVDGRPAQATAEQDGVLNKLWLVQDEATIQAVAQQIASRPVFIADGHHRYGTALNYRDGLLAEQELPDHHPARFILIGLCAMEDPGAVILPTHRVLSGFMEMPPSQVFAALQRGIEMRPVPLPADPQTLLTGDTTDDVAVYLAQGDKLYLGRFTQRAKLPTLASDKSPAWCELDVAYLHRYLIDELVSRGVLGGLEPGIQYLKAADQAINAARACNGIAFICKPCTMAQLRAVSEAGDLMPQKSTYFYPKLATGLVINPLE